MVSLLCGRLVIPIRKSDETLRAVAIFARIGMIAGDVLSFRYLEIVASVVSALAASHFCDTPRLSIASVSLVEKVVII